MLPTPSDPGVTMKMAKVAPLLVRPQMIGGECDLGYVDRVALANGLGTSSHELTADHVRMMVGPNAVPLEWRTENPYQFYADLMDDTLSHDGPLRRVPIWAQLRIVFKCPPVCRSCLAEARYVRAAWRLKGFDICPIHKELLVTCWNACGQRANTREVLLDRDLRYRYSHVASRGLIEPSELESEIIQRIWAPAVSQAASDHDLAVGVVCVLLLRMTTKLVKAGIRPPPSGRALARADGWLRPDLLGTETGVAFVGHLVSLLSGTRLRKDLHQFFSHASMTASYSPTILSSMPLAEWEALTAPLQLSTVMKTALPDTPIPLSELIKRTGATSSQVLHALKARNTSLSKTSWPVQVRTTIRAIEAQGLIADFDAGLSRRATVATLGLGGNRESLRRLRHAQVANFQYGRPGPYLRKPILALLSDLDKAALADPPQHRFDIPLSDARLIGRWNSNAIRELFEGLRTGVLPVWRAAQGAGLGKYRVPLDFLQRMHRRSRDLRKRIECPQQLELFDAGTS